MDNYEDDAMDDLMYDAAEGPAGPEAYDDAFDAYDEFDEDDDEFFGAIAKGLGGLLGGGGRRRRKRGGGSPLGGIGNILGGLLGADEFDEGDAFDEGDEFDAYDAYDEFDALDEGDAFDEGDEFDEGDDFDDADEFDEGDELEAVDDFVADALDSADSDEFFGKIGGFLRRVGKGVGSVARTVAPIASMIPLPQAQLIGRLAGVAGKLLADGADEFEVYDEMVDGLDEDELDAAAPLIAGLALRRALPAISRMTRPARRKLVRATSRSIRSAVRTRGRKAARVVPRAIIAARKVARRKRLPTAKVAPRIVRKITTRVVRRPRVVRVMARPLVPRVRRVVPVRRAVAVVRRAATPVRPRVVPLVRAVRRRTGLVPAVVGRRCPSCAGAARRTVNVRGPATIRVRCR